MRSLPEETMHNKLLSSFEARAMFNSALFVFER